MTLSCISTFLEKQIVFRANRLMRVLKFKFFLSIFRVLSFPTRCLFLGIYLLYDPRLSVWYVLIGNFSNNFHSSKKSSSRLFPPLPSQNATGVSFTGVPRPTLVGFALDKAPKLIGFAIKTNFNCQSRQTGNLFAIKEIRVRF